MVFLDNVIDANYYPIDEIERATRRTRKIGLGVMGLADLFARIGLAFDSEVALLFADKIANFLTVQAQAVPSSSASDAALPSIRRERLAATWFSPRYATPPLPV